MLSDTPVVGIIVAADSAKNPFWSNPMNCSLASVFLAIFLALGVAACTDSKTTEEHIQYAKDFREKGNLDAAVVELKNALRQSPQNAEARWLRGSIYLSTSDGAGAEKELERAVELGMDANEVAVSLMQAKLLQSKFQEVVDHAVDEASLDVDSQVKIWIMRGHANMGLEELDTAKQMYETVLALQAEEPEAALGVAQVAAHQDNLDKARELVTALLQVHPEFAPAWSFLADMEQFQRNYAAAEVAYGRALESRSDNVYDLINRALMRIFIDDFSGARSDFQIARRGNALLKVKQPLVQYVAGQLNYKDGNYANAVTAFSNTLEMAPNYLPARFYLATAHYQQGSLEQAEANLSLFRAQAPQYAAGHRLFAAIRFSQGEYPRAREELENILSFDPEDAWSLALLADIAVLENNPAQSVENYRKIVALHPESDVAHVRLALGLIITGDSESREVLENTSSPSGPDSQARMLIIVSYMKEENWKAAIKAGDKLVADDPDNWDALTLLGGAWLGQGNADKAAVLFSKALEMKPGNPNAANNLARLELKLGRVDEARKLYEEVLAHHPAQNSALMALSSLDVQEGKLVDAIARLEAAQTKDPENLQLKLTLASLYLRTGQPSRNIGLAIEVSKEEANNPQVLEVLGDSQMAMGQYDKALTSYEQLVSEVPQSAASHYRLVRALFSTNQMSRAGEELDKVIELQPDHFGASVMRIRMLRKLNRQEEAIVKLSAVATQYAERPEILIEQGWLAMYEGNYEKSVQSFEKAFEIVPSSLLALQVGIARWNSGDENGAIQSYENWLKANPDDLQVRFHLANSYMQLARNNDAVANFKIMLEQKPDDTALMNNIAWLIRDTDPKEAMEYAQRTVEIAPEWPPGLDTKGFLLMEQGELNQAYRLFGQALKRAPEDQEIRYHLALVTSKMGETEEAMQILKAVLAGTDSSFASREDAEKLMADLKSK
ncbi:MAG: putative PEP-CTERM system TPR-repeat lipoprotein [Halioglobus sp.]